MPDRSPRSTAYKVPKCASSSLVSTRLIRELKTCYPLAPFQERFIARAFAPETEIAGWSMSRGNGKSSMIGWIIENALTPGAALFTPGREVILCAASFAQARIVFDVVRQGLAAFARDYAISDNATQMHIRHRESGTSLRAISSSAKRALGLLNFSLIIGDEPASWEARGGQLMFDALRTSVGKLSGQRVILIGTQAPSLPGSWWLNLIESGSTPGRHVEVIAAPEDEEWDKWPTIRKANPLILRNPNLRRTILRERNEARKNPTLRPSFEAFRLNRPSGDAATVLLTVPDWRKVLARPVPPREGEPVVGLDIGGERSWCGAWAIWANGRCEAYASIGGLPSLEDRERQDALPSGAYTDLCAAGSMIVDDGHRIARPSVLIDHLADMGVFPSYAVCDRFLRAALEDAINGRFPLMERKTRWSESTEDIAAFRKLAIDGQPHLAMAPESVKLATLSLSQATVLTDDQGSCRIIKSRAHRSRDDVAVCGTLAAGALDRDMQAGSEIAVAIA